MKDRINEWWLLIVKTVLKTIFVALLRALCIALFCCSCWWVLPREDESLKVFLSQILIFLFPSHQLQHSTSPLTPFPSPYTRRDLKYASFWVWHNFYFSVFPLVTLLQVSLKRLLSITLLTALSFSSPQTPLEHAPQFPLPMSSAC